MKQQIPQSNPAQHPWHQPEAGWPSFVPTSLQVPPWTLFDSLKARVEETPDLRALWFLGKTLSFQELFQLVDKLSQAFWDQGLRKGDVLGLILPNCPQYVAAYYAAMRLGVVVTGVDPTLKPAEIAFQLKHCNVKRVICLDIMAEAGLSKLFASLGIIAITTRINDFSSLEFLDQEQLVGLSELQALIRTTATATIESNVTPEDVAVYLMTGGTTGKPKAVVLTHANCISNVFQIRTWLQRGPGSACVGLIPLFHAFGMTSLMNSTLRGGGWMVLFPTLPTTEELVKTIETVCPDESTFYPGAEILFKRLGDYLEANPESRVGKKFFSGVSGAGPLRRQVKEKFERFTGAQLVEGYGLSEAGPVVSTGPYNHVSLTGTIGLPLPGTEWRIVDAENHSLIKELYTTQGSSHEVFDEQRFCGELIISGPQVMKEYLNNPEETNQAFRMIDGKRWLLTGDIGYMDTLGRVTLKSRKKELIKVFGHSVFPAEVEELMAQHPAIAEVTVAGVPHSHKGEQVKAWVVLRPDQLCTTDELWNWCRDNLTTYKCPSEIEIVTEIPKTSVGKVLRRVLVDREKAKEVNKNQDGISPPSA